MEFNTFRERVMKDPSSPEHGAMLRHVRGLIDKSRGDMSKNYSTWDIHDQIFRARRPVDREDAEAKAKGKPIKIAVPMGFSQIMTFVAFSVMSITQNRRFFELEPTGTEDNPLLEPLELILERDLRRNQWITFLVQFFLNIGKFSLSAAEICYEEDFRYMRVEKTEQVPGAFGTSQEKTTFDFQKIPVFEGNKVYTISPYRFFPDTNLPISQYQRGEFCGSEDVFTVSGLKSLGGDLFNLDKIPKYTEVGYEARRKVSRVDLGPPRENPNLGAQNTNDPNHSSEYATSGPVTVTKIVFQARPKDLKFNVGEKNEDTMGEEDFPVRYICWYANDKTVIRLEEAYYLHGMFPYIAAQYIPDQHEVVSQSLSDICEQITDLITWKMNAHITSIRSNINGRVVIDPSGIDTKKLDSRSPYIYLKQGASQTGVDRYIKQLDVTDTTQNVMKDITELDSLQEKISGWSAQMQGQYSTGRRSATQDRVVAQGAGARGKTIVGSIWDTAFEPLGKQLIANNRQEMNFETFKRIVGEREWPINRNTGVAYTVDEIFVLFKADAVSIATAEDFFVFDGTLPSEKAFLAQSLQEILMTIMTNPEVALVLGFDANVIKELFNQVYLLRGVTPARLPTKPTAAPGQAAPPKVLPTPPAITSGAA